MHYQEYDDFFVFSKPYGVRTHKVAEGQYGFVEYLAEKLGRPLFVVHRLDKETSGLMLFAKSKEASAALSSLFETHEIHKTYVFLTDQKITKTELTVTSHIEKQSEFFVNIDGKDPNSETDFKFLKEVNGNFLWQANPVTGKPHQIRLHAQKAGIPILGDNQHAGSRFFRLALHAQQLKFNYKSTAYNFTSPHDVFINIFEDAWNLRKALYEFEEKECFRLLHLEHPEIRADVLGDRLWVYDYSEAGLSNNESRLISVFSETKNLKSIIRQMLNRGAGVGGLEKQTLSLADEENWVATENSIAYQFKTDSGFSPGLFLDQRENRSWVRQNSNSKKVLNLFAYTGGLSVNAAVGEASEVTTVDVSKKFLDWSRENFKLNSLDPEKYEFFAQDSILFLKGSVKRNRKWDLIICDPPSFGRSKDGVWKLEQNISELAELMMACLNPKGRILFTCNLEKRSRNDILNLFCKKLQKFEYAVERIPMLSLDYEETDDLKNLMKGFFIIKK